MCGIAGLLHPEDRHPSDEALLQSMLASLRHRGPDEFGIYCDGQVGLASARLSIIDLAGGQQPISNEEGNLWLVFNGEIYNYPELRAGLLARGHRLATQTDTETVIHLYEEEGPGCLSRLRGQFAFALWDRPLRRLFLARDPLGVRPLFYCRLGGDLLFASEIKALLCHKGLQAAIDPQALAQVFTLWTPLPGHTAFQGIRALPPGHYTVLQGGEPQPEPVRYWQLRFPESPSPVEASVPELAAHLRSRLREATLLRLRADVPVGVYVSGGLDSSLIAALVARESQTPLETFSISFADHHDYDESQPQAEVVRMLGTRHHSLACTEADIARVFPEVVRHAETPLLRTSPAPLFLLSELVRQAGFRVVLTGEGADEFLAGYDIFKEDRVRRFWARCPSSALRPRLLGRLYPYVPGLGAAPAYQRAFFGRDLLATGLPNYSHLVRWQNGARLARFFSSELRAAVQPYDPQGEFVATLDDEVSRWPALSRAQYLEITLFLSEFLLSSQGDRMSMSHSVEGRYPFLDPGDIEFCNALDPRLKLRGLHDKYLLRRCAEPLLPRSIWQRPKQPYRAPIAAPLLCPGAGDYARDLLSDAAIRGTGYFDPSAVDKLLRKHAAQGRLGELDSMALAGIISTQLLHELFVARRPEADRSAVAPLRVIRGPMAVSDGNLLVERR